MDAYDGDAEDKTRDHVLDKDDQAAKNKPDDVSYEVHGDLMILEKNEKTATHWIRAAVKVLKKRIGMQ